MRRWSVGTSRWWFERSPHEWRAAYLEGGRDTAIDVDDLEVAVPDASDQVPEEARRTRYSFAETAPGMTVTPRLPDRPVVARPDEPFYVPAGEQARLFVSSPLWFSASVAPHDTQLIDVPCLRPSDTWFGANTLDGELCYAVRTNARTDLSTVPRRPHRAVTPVVVHNRAGGALLLERLKVPVTLLSLYADRDGGLWTEEVTLVRDHEDDEADLQLGRGAPAEATAHGTGPHDARSPKESDRGRPERVAGPRAAPEARATLRAFARLFRG